MTLRTSTEPPSERRPERRPEPRPRPQRQAGRQRDPHMDVAVIEAVLDLLSEGATLSGLSLVEIAARAGVSRNSVYRRWKTKDELYMDVLDSVNQPLPDFAGPSAREDIRRCLVVLIERTLNQRASRMPRALNAEAEAFPELHRRYFEEIVQPRRDVMYHLVRGGIESGEIRPDVDVGLVNEVLVGPVLARLAAGDTRGLDPHKTSRQITDLVFAGLAPR